MTIQGGPGIPRSGEETPAHAIAGGGEQPFDEAEGFFEGGAAGIFLSQSGGVFGGAGDGGAEGENLVGEAGVDGAGGDGVEVDGLVVEFLGEGFNEADDAGFRDAVSGEVDAGFGGAAAGEGDDLGAAGGAGEQAVKGAERIERAVEIGAHGGTPFCGIGSDGGADLALETGAADEAVEVCPRGGDGGGGGLDLSPVGDIAAGGEEGAGVLGGEVGLVGAGEAADVVSA